MLGAFDELIAVMAKLRGEGGCPWDRKQTNETLRTYIVEEAYELVEAITGGIPSDIKEECGDLLLQIVFISQIAKENGQFEIDDVVSGIVQKLVRRHPHVFGSVVANDSDEVLRNWEQIKLKEKESKRGTIKEAESGGILSGVPSGLPALLKAFRIQEKVAHVGFDWEKGNLEPLFDKVYEEIDELREANDLKESSHIEEEFGDLLFAAVNLGRHLGVNPDVALGRANLKFMSRFAKVEKMVAESGKSWDSFSLAELDNFWNKAKEI